MRPRSADSFNFSPPNQSLFHITRHEAKSNAVDAVALVGGGVEAFAFEDMAEVAIAVRAEHFGADAPEAGVLAGDDIFRFGGIVKRWPAAAGLKFFIRCEKQRVAPGAVVTACALILEFFVCGPVWAFGASLAQDVVLLGTELATPFVVGFDDLALGFCGWLGG
ncbi:MAG: hypothetical protein RLY69_8 [Verrucomicrobiota bacterium]